MRSVTLAVSWLVPEVRRQGDLVIAGRRIRRHVQVERAPQPRESPMAPVSATLTPAGSPSTARSTAPAHAALTLELERQADVLDSTPDGHDRVAGPDVDRGHVRGDGRRIHEPQQRPSRM